MSEKGTIVGLSCLSCAGATLLLVPSLGAAPRSDWSAVVALGPGTEVSVTRADASVVEGILAQSDPNQVVVLELAGLGLSGHAKAQAARQYASGETSIVEGPDGRIDLTRHARGVAREAVERLEARRGVGDRALGAVLGGVAGFYAGALSGAALEKGLAPCDCDDPGLQGALIGAPIGLGAGAVVGHELVNRRGRLVYERSPVPETGAGLHAHR